MRREAAFIGKGCATTWPNPSTVSTRMPLRSLTVFPNPIDVKGGEPPDGTAALHPQYPAIPATRTDGAASPELPTTSFHQKFGERNRLCYTIEALSGTSPP